MAGKEMSDDLACRLEVITRARVHAEKLRGLVELAVVPDGVDRRWRSVELQMAFIVGIIANAMEEERDKFKEKPNG